MEQYLEKLLSQIRCKKARPFIAEELKNHMECQIEDNLQEGMEYEEAERKAVEDMGDPIEVGISLDRIHKPRMAWGLLLLMAVISVFGIWVQCSILSQDSYQNLDAFSQAVYRGNVASFVVSVCIGFILGCLVYFLDYTGIAKYAKVIGWVIIALGVLVVVGFFGVDLHGVRYRVGFGALSVAVAPLMMFYVPVYAGILYKYRNGEWKEFLKALMWMIVPVFIAFKIPNVAAAGIMLVSMFLQLMAAVLKGWFRIPIKRTIVCLWTAILILPATILGMLYSFHLLEQYQEDRIRSFLAGTGEGSFLTGRIRALLTKAQWWGCSDAQVIGNLPEFNRDYIFTYVITTYGGLIGLLIIVVLVALILSVFSIAFKQKNELGLVMGVGCGSLLLVNLGVNVLGAIGAIPPVSSFLPFFSLGRDNVLLSYVLVGIVMSIYRFKDVYPAKVEMEPRSITKEFTINI